MRTTRSLAKVVPSLIDNATGLFTIPSTRTDLAGFFRVQQQITKAIDTALVGAQVKLTPTQAAALDFQPIRFGPSWRASEIGVTSNLSTVSVSPAYGHKSFINGIVPVEGSDGQFYSVIREQDGAATSLVSPQPTTLPCVNTILLAEATSAGTWIPPSYVLGKPGGQGWLVVDRCVDIAAPNSMNTLSPSASLYIAIQWSDDVPEFAHMRTNDTSMMHNEAVVKVVGPGAVDGTEGNGVAGYVMWMSVVTLVLALSVG